MNRAAVAIPEKLFFKIGEVCDLTGVQAHVLRYWESEFPMLAPQKNRAGQRTYRKRDVEMVIRIKDLLYEDQYTIAGAKKKLTSELRGASKLKVVTPEMSASAPPVSVVPAPSVAPQTSPIPPQPAAVSAINQMSEAEPIYAAPTEGRLTRPNTVAVNQLKSQLIELLNILKADPA
jgi:DNA-binding transcriptional MerR regulator